MAIVANNCTAKKRSVMSLRAVLFFFALLHCLGYTPFSSDLLEFNCVNESYAIRKIRGR